MKRSPSPISPTAHYTGFVWLQHGLSERVFHTPEGAGLYHALRPVNALSRALGGASLEAMLIARHRVIDHILARAIRDHGIRQVVEIAAGLSPRGTRFTRRFPELTYVEADLPAMVERKRDVLSRLGPGSANHHVTTVDVLADDGEHALSTACHRFLDPGGPTAVVTEGLFSYLSTEQTTGVWSRYAQWLSGFPRGLFLADLNVDTDLDRIIGARLFLRLLRTVTRASTDRLFLDPSRAKLALDGAGFADSTIDLAGDFADELGTPDARRSGHIHVIEAWTRTGWEP